MNKRTILLLLPKANLERFCFKPLNVTDTVLFKINNNKSNEEVKP